MLLKVYLVIFLITFGAVDFRACAQQNPLRFDHLTTANGLSQNTVTGIAKDKYGFMWFGTWSGLCRFDGYKFKVYRQQKNNGNSLVNNRIYNVAVDKNKNLWIVTFNDSIYCRYRYETDDFERVPQQRLTKNFKRSISRNGHLLNTEVSYNGYTWQLDRKEKDLVQKELASGKILRYQPDPLNPWSVNDQFATDLFLDDQHILWVGTFSNGINKANLGRKIFKHTAQIPGKYESIIDKNVFALSRDHDGNLWVGTRNKGITVISDEGKYRHFVHDDKNPGSLNHNNVKTIFCDSKGNIWIGTYKGLNHYNTVTGTMHTITSNGIENAHVFGITEDREGNLWFATWSGIYKYLAGQKAIVKVNIEGFQVRYAMSMMEDHLKRIWIGTEGNGAAVFECKGDSGLKMIKHFSVNAKIQNELSDDKVYSIYEDNNNAIWIATANGVDQFNSKLQLIKQIGSSPNGLSSASVSGLTEDNQGYIWVSHSRGVSRIDKRNYSIRNFSTSDGLGNDFSEGSIYKDYAGVLYFGGNNGFDTCDPQQITTDRSLTEVRLTELQILNKTVNVNDTVNDRVLLTRPLYLTRKITLNHLDRSISLEFSSMNMVNPAANKYAYMLEGFDKDWIYTDATKRTAVYANLSRGHYTFKVRASNSDGVWNNTATLLQLNVMPPWWSSTLAYAIYIILSVLIIYFLYSYSLRLAKLKHKLAFENLIHEREIEFHQDKINFFTNISHEIKTPLSLILAPIERMMTGSELNEKMQEQLHIMRKSGNRLLKLVNELLDMRRLETGNAILKLSDTELNETIKRIADSFGHVAKEKEITFTVNTIQHVLFCQLDTDKIEKVLYNLLSNAFKFTGIKGTIAIDVNYPDPEYFTIKVANNGELIDHKDLQRIFEPFQQGNHQQGGTGLGLAFTKSLVELHGGNISVKSLILPGGQNHTAFLITLPFIAADTAQYKDVEEAISPVSIAVETTEILPEQCREQLPLLLIVEDNPELRAYLIKYFRDFYRITEAEHGASGLKKALEEIPDLILSDLMMPEMDGISFCKAIKNHLATNHIPFILLTAHTPLETQIESAKSGADEYVAKPFNLELLALKVSNLLAVRSTLQQKYQRKVTVQPTLPAVSSPDEKLLQKIWAYVDENISDPNLDIAGVCEGVGLGRTQLYRKMKALTGLSMAEMIRDFRLERAKQLLAGKRFNVNEVCYMTGINDVAYFRKIFKAKTGLSPSEYAKNTIN